MVGSKEKPFVPRELDPVYSSLLSLQMLASCFIRDTVAMSKGFSVCP